MSPEMRQGPISPVEIAELKEALIPEAVFAVFNELIAQNVTPHGVSKVLQDEVVARLEARGMSRHDLYKNHWLDVEPSYEAAGWDVQYERPVYWGGEDFDAYFKFSPKQPAYQS